MASLADNMVWKASLRVVKRSLRVGSFVLMRYRTRLIVEGTSVLTGLKLGTATIRRRQTI